jgi:glycine cleavage system H protein
MHPFTSHNIFATKGIEYLVIIAFLLILIPFWLILNRKPQILTTIKDRIGVFTATSLQIPMGLFFSKRHTWTFLEKSGIAKVGMDDFLVKCIGRARINLLKNSGQKINKGDEIFEIIQNDKKLRIKSPISGEVVLNNSELNENPETLNEPYDSGWIYSVKPTNWKSDTKNYYVAEEAKNWITEEITKFKDFVNESLNSNSNEPTLIKLQEGGALKQNLLADLDENAWAEFQKKFLE